ncbi:MAG TPA: hypothetical protein VGX78_00420 [Pirellulales bacterium]|nr:hypothetical protein [Pirellulales bacterium]
MITTATFTNPAPYEYQRPARLGCARANKSVKSRRHTPCTVSSAPCA